MIISIFTGPWLPVPAVQGGSVPRLWQGLAEKFVAKGHQVTILCRSYPKQPQQEVINGVNYVRWGGFPQSTNIWWDLLKDLTYALISFPRLPAADILVINDFWLPVFATLQPYVGQVVINCARFPKGQYWLYGKVDRFYAVSNAIKEAILKEYPPANNRLKVIPNPVNTDVFFPPTQPKLKQGEEIILYVGRIHPEKGIHLLLDAFSILSRQIPRVKLKIIGPIKENQGGGGGNYLYTLQNKVEGLNVEFVEPIFDIHKLAEAYRQADLFCYPSLAEKGESFGVAPLEAMASGLVPIVSDLACFRDFIDEGETGYFFDHRSNNASHKLSDTLLTAISNSDKNYQMSLKAAQKALFFNYEQIAKFYLDDWIGGSISLPL
ncbi:glycosyltransferase family 4 protein [Nostoc sp.]|uniref:glycosyltransferase family 4 protein n=1 Tax=Nostoc sp. TaxID=1180 RepID=UPI003FA5633E